MRLSRLRPVRLVFADIRVPWQAPPMPMPTVEEQREYQRQWIAKRRAEWIAVHGPCKKCGSSVDLEIDHVDPKKKSAHVSIIWSWSKKRREAELKKCQVLCHECHVKKTNVQTYAPMKHGTVRMRRKGRCACIACKRAVADDRAYYRTLDKRGVA